MTKLKINNFQQKFDLPKLEHEVLHYWDETKAFEKSVEIKPENKRYVFYDGPPFATGLPHYGHILASTIKDVVPRYWTMKGFRVDRVWGWDCHGIPIENMIEKELDLRGGKKGIEEMGIGKFNAACKTAILRFDTEWEKVIRRIGRWVDFKNSYKTMDNSYMESVWWAFKTLYEKGLVYEGKKVILYCPRCATPLSNFEIAMDNSYKDVKDNSVYVKFKLKARENEYLVAWTTTPWTLVGNVGLAIDEKAEYVKVKVDNEFLWLAQRLILQVLGSDPKTYNETRKGQDLAGWEYEPLFKYMPLDGKKSHYVGVADFVSLEEGTGIVHTAAIFGEDDYRFAIEHDLPRVPTLNDQGKFLDFVEPLKGVFYKNAEDWIIEDLKKRGLVLRAEKTLHSYPFCYRCETPLYYNAVPAWFIDVQKMKSKMLEQNEHINWYPDYLKYGRFGKGLETAPDWNISRSRYWGTPMPVWKSSVVNRQSSDKEQYRIIGSVEELKKWAVNPHEVEELKDLHREFLDDIEVWVNDAKTVKGKRIPEVFDCWVESGSMPYASIHYPFENKELFEKTHPAQYIAEYIAQTRAWFYTLHVMSVGLFAKHTFENAVTTGTILAEDGTKMSKSKKNYPDPSLLFEKYGVDALRFYLMSSVVMKGENLNFSEKQVQEIYQKVISILWNTFAFYKLYANDEHVVERFEKHIILHDLDRWVVSRTHSLVKSATSAMDHYDTVSFCRIVAVFIDELSTWYLRRSRERLKTDKAGRQVFGWVLKQLTLVISPVMPFLGETIYQNLEIAETSVHLDKWPVFDESYIDKNLEDEMTIARKIVEQAHAARKANTMPVRQPLARLTYDIPQRLPSGLEQLIAEEVNVKQVVYVSSGSKLEAPAVTLDMHLTPELQREGEVRALIRKVQQIRKEKGCLIDEKIVLTLPKVWESRLDSALLQEVQNKTLAKELVWGNTDTILIG